MQLLERDRPLAEVRQCIARLQDSVGGCVLVHGEAGVGKTSLLRQAQVDSAAHADWVWGACDPLLAPPPLAPLIDWIAALPPALGDAVRSGRRVADVMAGLLDWLRGSSRPRVLVVDDAQWADDATLEMLRYLGRRVGDTRTLLVTAWRDPAGDGDEPLRTLAGSLPSRCTLRLPLRPLSPAAVAEMARGAGRDGDELFRVTQGNPFFVAELLDGRVDRLPAAVRDAVLVRARPLPSAAREVLDLVSVVPGGAEADVVDAILDDAASGLDRGVAAGLLELTGGVARFRHELARQSIESALSPRRRQALHTALFDTLAQRGSAATRLVHHAEHAGLTAAVLRLAPLAAYEAALGGAHRQAAELYALALGHGDALDDAERADLWTARAEQSLLANRFDDALAARHEALQGHARRGDRLAEGIQLRQIARLHWLRGRSSEGQPLAQAAIELLATVPGAARELAMAQATMAQLHLLDGTADAALDWSLRALPAMETLHDTEGLSYVLNTLGTSRLRETDSAQAWQQLERSLALALDAGLREHVLRGYVNLASLALVHRRLDLLDRACRDGLAYCERQGTDLFAARLTIRAAWGQTMRGRLADAAALLGSLRDRGGLHAMEDEQSAHALALIALRRGDPSVDGYWREVVDGRRALGVDPWYAPQSVTRAEAAWLRGDAALVQAIVAESLPAALASREGWRIGQLLCWASRAGAAPGTLPPDAPLAEPCRLELAGQSRAAADAWAARGCRYERALALLADPRDAVAVREALSLLDAMDAAAAARIARRRLRRLGVRDVARGPIRGTRVDPLGLTPRERTVVDALREGLTNRQIAERLHRSERTVDKHVAALLAKLGARTRGEAAALAAPADAETGGSVGRSG